MKKNLLQLLVPLLSIATVTSFAQNKESKYGYSFPTEGIVKVMVVFAEQADAQCPSQGTTNWPANQIPSNTADYFDHSYSASGNYSGKLTQLYHSASFGELPFLGDYLDHVVQVPCGLSRSASGNAVPAKEYIVVKYDVLHLGDGVVFELLDVSGKLALSQTLQNTQDETVINLRGIKPGNYTYRIMSNSTMHYSGKVVVAD